MNDISMIFCCLFDCGPRVAYSIEMMVNSTVSSHLDVPPASVTMGRYCTSFQLYISTLSSLSHEPVCREHWITKHLWPAWIEIRLWLFHSHHVWLVPLSYIFYRIRTYFSASISNAVMFYTQNDAWMLHWIKMSQIHLYSRSALHQVYIPGPECKISSMITCIRSRSGAHLVPIHLRSGHRQRPS